MTGKPDTAESDRSGLATEALGKLLRLGPSEPMDDITIAEFLRMLADPEFAVLAEVAAAFLGANEISVAACYRLVGLMGRAAPTRTGLELIDQLILAFGRHDGFIDARLTHLLRLGPRQALLAELERTLEVGISSIHLAFKVLIAANRAYRDDEKALSELYRQSLVTFSALVETIPERDLWWGRYFREARNSLASMRHYLTFSDTAAASNRYRPAALREASEIAVVGGRWGRDAPILLRARELGIDSRRPWRTNGAARVLDAAAEAASLDPHANIPGTDEYSHLFDWIGTPECAFDYLIDKVLPNVERYEAQNSLLMVGTSLAGGGMERIFANSYRAVKAAGTFDSVHMALVNFEQDSSTSFYLAESGATADEITVLLSDDVPDVPIAILPMSLARRVLPAFRLVLRERPRVIHAWNDLAGIIGAFAGLLAGCPRIFVHFHHMRAINLSTDRNLIRSYPACYRRLLERPEIEMLFVADASAEDYADWWCLERTAKFRRLYNGFLDIPASVGGTEDIRDRLEVPRDAHIVGTVFRFNAVKRPWLWIDAAKLVNARLPDVHFVMVGDGEDLETSRARVASYGLSDRFHFIGQVKNVNDYLSCFDLFLMTSWVEGLPNSLVEAQLAGVPVVCTNVGGVRETFIPGVTGVLVEDDSPKAIADAVVHSLENVSWRRYAKVRSREAAVKRFGIERYLSSLIEMYGPGR